MPSTSSSREHSSSSRSQTPQEQLAERRERLKRKAEEELQHARGHSLYGSAPLPPYESDRKGKGRASLDVIDVESADVTVSARDAERVELDVDMLLDGLGIDEGVKKLAREDSTFRQDLIQQLMTVPMPDDWSTSQSEAYDLEDDDEYNEYLPSTSTFCKAWQCPTHTMASAEHNVVCWSTDGPPRPPLPFTFKNGALRITRTPGRAEADTPNCISMEELIDKDSLEACCVFAFFIAGPEFYGYLPMLPQAKVPVSHCLSDPV